ncbi:uncharacterized protein GGS22DRAFT_104580 [Annulohypoxylon maeteangense]|uniref:uncharacterized protein n=1 Tax=Annulohypoxylon maeteangense TaxID=1927788 RepID=UPI002007AD1A|nr:uncharacterized protein GGS22DRAFT_104580 [Annulohypoxylon maeteangense]KAI0887115.1 hypothetical protein GGS22DRAFT_104580 [Annulohypoxylon maeteangense]
MTAPSIPRKRAHKPKVRSGCVTCKTRRVKCGEERPICRRCQKSWLPCKYNSPETNQGEHHSHANEQAVVSFQAETSEKSGSRLLPRVQRDDFQDLDIIYFDLFRSAIVKNLCLNGYTNFWSRTILREIFRDECVRDCVLGIGALRRAMMEDTKDASSSKSKALWVVPKIATTSLSTRYHRDAIKYYTKSISKFRSRMSQEGSSTPSRTILILSILFVMFEAIQGNSESVDRIMQAAIFALEDCTPGLGTENQGSNSLDDEGVREADYFLTRFSGYSSLLCPFYPSLLKGPASHRNWSLAAKIPSWSDDLRQIELAFERYTTSSLIWSFRSCQAHVFSRPIDHEKNRDEQLIIYLQAHDWCKFLTRKLDQETDSLRRRTWKMMLVEAKMFTIYTRYSRSAEERELLWDFRIDECSEVIALVESILDELTSRTTLPPLFEDKLLPTLRCLVCKCRDYETRMKALALCERLSGPWFENRAVSVGMRIMIELEERDRDEFGFIPTESRYRWNTSSFNVDRTELRMGLISTITGARKELTIRQDGNIDDLIQKLTASPSQLIS